MWLKGENKRQSSLDKTRLIMTNDLVLSEDSDNDNDYDNDDDKFVGVNLDSLIVFSWYKTA